MGAGGAGGRRSRGAGGAGGQAAVVESEQQLQLRPEVKHLVYKYGVMGEDHEIDEMSA